MSDEEPWYRMLIGLFKSPAKTKQNAPAPPPTPVPAEAPAPGPSTASQPPQQARAFRPVNPSATGSSSSSGRWPASKQAMTGHSARIRDKKKDEKPKYSLKRPKSPKEYHQETLVSRDQRGVKPLVSFGKGSEASFAAAAVQKATGAVPKKRGEESSAYNEKKKKQTDMKTQFLGGKEGKNYTDASTSTRKFQQQRTPTDTTAPLKKTTAIGKRASSQSAADKPKMRPYKSLSECSLRRYSQVEGLGPLEQGLDLSVAERRRRLGGYGYKARSPLTSSLSRSASSRSLNLTSSPESPSAYDADRSSSSSREAHPRHGAGRVTHRSSSTEQSMQSFDIPPKNRSLKITPSGTLALRSRKDKFLAMQKKDKDTKSKGPKRQ